VREERSVSKRSSSAATRLACIAAVALLVAGCGSGGAKTSGSGGSSSQSRSGKRESGIQAYANRSIHYASVPPSAPVQSGVVQIAYRNIAIEPDVVKVKVGSTIKWTNYDEVPHNVVSEGGPLRFASRQFGEGGAYQIKVTKTGVIHYECTLEPTTMNGTIEVVS
jgi:plastocyanin